MKAERKKKGFTIVELLTVMAVMALLLSILAPALRMVRRIAKDMGQRAQFHGIDVALEMFDGENDGYPTSTALPSTTSPYTVGAQHLAEALIGRDMLGFDPQTSWDAKADETKKVYGYGTAPQREASLDRRKGPYLASENVESFQIQQLYGTGTTHTGNVYDGNDTPSPVLTDSYRIKTVVLGNGRQVKAGTPILYYKANTSSQSFPNADDTGKEITDPCASASIFNSMDNEDLIDLGHMIDQTQQHHFDGIDPKYTDSANRDGRRIFYKTITNPKITSPIRPYNQSSYLLMSAGVDGLYGTRDDIYNFQ